MRTLTWLWCTNLTKFSSDLGDEVLMGLEEDAISHADLHVLEEDGWVRKAGDAWVASSQHGEKRCEVTYAVWDPGSLLT